MRAVVLEGRGGVEVLHVKEVPEPQPGPGEVRVRVRAAGLNRADLLQRMGLYAQDFDGGSEIPGLEFAGEVERLGPNVRSLAVGERVFGICSRGGQGELLVVPERGAVRVPDSLDDVSAASIPEAFITAHDALFTVGNLRSGESILIQAVGSGVGVAAAQLAHVAGALVLGASRTESKLESARALGVDVPIHTGKGRWAEAARDATSGRGVDLIADFLGASGLAENLASLGPRGRLVVIGLLGGATGEIDLSQVLGKRLRVEGTMLRGRPFEEKLLATQLFAREVVPLFARGLVKPVIDRAFPVAEVRAAHERMASNESFGKIVLTF